MNLSYLRGGPRQLQEEDEFTLGELNPREVHLLDLRSDLEKLVNDQTLKKLREFLSAMNSRFERQDVLYSYIHKKLRYLMSSIFRNEHKIWFDICGVTEPSGG